MFEILVYIFAIIGVVEMAAAVLGLILKSAIPAYIIYPMDNDDGDAHHSLQVLSRMNMPMIVIKADEEDTTALEKEFLYADFVKRSVIGEILNNRI